MAAKSRRDNTTDKPQLKALRLAKLKPHPKQERFFRQYGHYEYETLKADIRDNGLKNPIEVVPADNAAGLEPLTIINGHTRCKILTELGIETTEVLLRYDLLDASASEITKLFLLDNVARRQQDRLGQAHAAIQHYKIEREQLGRQVDGDPMNQEKLRDQIGAIIGVSGRTLQRYRNILAGPIEVQDAFESGQIKLVDAARVTSLPPKEQNLLAKRLRDGEDPKVVFAAFFPPEHRGHVKLSNAIACLVRTLETAQSDLFPRLAEVTPGSVRKSKKQLRGGIKLLEGLLHKIDE